MKKALILLIIALFLLPSILAINVTITKISANETMIRGLGNPATFKLELKNDGDTDTFRIFNLIGFQMSPESVSLASGQTKQIGMTIYPRTDFDYKQYFTFIYFIRSMDDSESEQKLLIKVVDLEDAFEIGTDELDPESDSVNVYIHNKENFNFEDLTVKFTSRFFESEEETFSLGANKRKDFTFKLDKEKVKELSAGFYTLNTQVAYENLSAGIDSKISFKEKNLSTTTNKKFGFIINTEEIKISNDGNTIQSADGTIKKNIISRLFTTLSPSPDSVDRKGFSVYYTWERQLNPGESLNIIVKTNWILPILIIVLIIVIIVFVKIFTRRDITLRKKVHFIHAKGGEFALKVSVYIQANKYLERISIIDRLPPLVRVYERFGGEQPKRIDEKNRRIDWSFEKLEQGEVRMISYVIYSKVGIMGKFALPPATAIYEKEGVIKESTSNRAFFVSEPRSNKDLERDE